MKTSSMNKVLACFLGLFLIFQHSLAQDFSVSRNTNIESDKGTIKWKSSSGFNSFNVEYRGKIEIENDDKDIAAMSDGAYLEISKTVFGSTRSVVIESIGGGKFKKQYYEGRTMVNWEPYGREWLAEILPEVVRTTTLCAESRVKRFFKQGGTSAVLSEIGKIESDYVKSAYADLLMKQPVQAKDYAPIINKVAEGMDSDHYLTEFLKDNTTKFMQDKEATTALFSATRKMDSDHYKTVVIKSALKGQIASLENVKIILQAASMMESDHYITEVLTSLLKQDNLNDAIISEMINTTKSIESDHYRTVVLTQALDKEGLSTASFQRVIESAKGIESDHYVTQVIKHLMDNKLSDDLLTLLLDMVTSVESDHYRTEVLQSLLRRQDLTEAQFDKLIQAASTMDSDHYKSTVLQSALSKKPTLSDGQFNKVIESCGMMESDHYKTVVLQGVYSETLTETKVLAIINASKEIDSDHYVTEVLSEVAPKVKTGSSQLKEAYRTAAKRIDSETYYGRALRAIE
ncbi:MAG TPA: hypothetical protein VGK39_03675 [Cyclobacteriaceae bacterium]